MILRAIPFCAWRSGTLSEGPKTSHDRGHSNHFRRHDDRVGRRRAAVLLALEKGKGRAICAVDDKVGHPVRQGVGFAGAGTGNDQERPTQGAIPFGNSMLYRTALLSIESIEMDGCQGHDRIILRLEF
jgi:hypothetical protein